MIVTKHGIKVVAYVHTADGLKDVDEDLTPEQRKKLADHVKCTWLNYLYRGKAVFFPEERSEVTDLSTAARSPSPIAIGEAETRERIVTGGGAALAMTETQGQIGAQRSGSDLGEDEHAESFRLSREARKPDIPRGRTI